MGLKNKADTLRKVPLHGALPDFNEDSDYYTQDDFSVESEKVLDALKKKGKIDKEELFKTSTTGLEKSLSHYLLPDDITGSTLPVDSNYSLNSRIEALINLIELSKELAVTENPDDLWESLLFNILGQVGAREAAIFVKEENRMNLKSYRGFIFPEDFALSKRSGIERILIKDMNIHYGNAFAENVVGDEYDLFKSLQIELVIPIIHFDELHGFILLGKTIGASDYTIEDLLYLKLLGEIIGSFQQVIERSEILNTQKKLWNTREKIYQKYLYFQQKLQTGKSPDETNDIFESYMSDVFAFQAYLFFVLDEHEEYVLINKKGLHENSYKNLKFSPEDEVIFSCQQNHSWFTHPNLLADSMFTDNLGTEDLLILKESKILPLFFHENLYGFFILLKVKNDIPSEHMYYAQNIIITYFWYYLSHVYLKRVENNLKIAITDPMHAVRAIISRHEKKLSQTGNTYAIYIVQIVNQERLVNLFGEKYANSVRNKIKKMLNEEFRNIQYISNLFSNKLFVIMDNMDKAQLWILDKSFVKKVPQLFPDEQRRPIIHNRLYARPEDKERSLEQLINW